MKYGRWELLARLAFLFTLLYTSSHPWRPRNKTKQNNQIKQNKTKNQIVYRVVIRLAWKGKGKSQPQSLAAASSTGRRSRVGGGWVQGSSQMAPASNSEGGGLYPANEGKWVGGERAEERSPTMSWGRWDESTGVGQRGVPLHQKPLLTSHPLLQLVLVGVRVRLLLREPGVRKRKVQLERLLQDP